MFEWLGLSGLKAIGAWVLRLDVPTIAKSVADSYAASASAKANTTIATVGAQRDVAIVDSQTHAQIVVETIRSDLRRSELQDAQTSADRSDWTTRWIRPAFCALAIVWIGWSLWLWIAHGVPLEDIVKYLLGGIVASLFVLRPFEKQATAAAKATIAANPSPTK